MEVIPLCFSIVKALVSFFLSPHNLLLQRSFKNFQAIRSRSLTAGQSVAALRTLPLRFPADFPSLAALRSLDSTELLHRSALAPVSEFAAPPKVNVTLVQFCTLFALVVSVCQCVKLIVFTILFWDLFA